MQLVVHYDAKSATIGECIDALFHHLARVVEPTVELTRLLFVRGSGGETFPHLAAALTKLVARGQSNGEVRADQEAYMLAELLYLEVVACLLGWRSVEGVTLAQLFQQRARLVTTNLLI